MNEFPGNVMGFGLAANTLGPGLLATDKALSAQNLLSQRTLYAIQIAANVVAHGRGRNIRWTEISRKKHTSQIMNKGCQNVHRGHGRFPMLTLTDSASCVLLAQGLNNSIYIVFGGRGIVFLNHYVPDVWYGLKTQPP
jgi:hypothetical protein